MNEAVALIAAWVVGGMLGAIFFGGLWWTVRRGIASPRPALWFFGSLLLRTGIVVAGFYVVSMNHWPRLLPCLLGFVMAQLVATQFGRPTENRQARRASEVGRAP